MVGTHQTISMYNLLGGNAVDVLHDQYVSIGCQSRLALAY
jgi:hypothetical protein